MRYLLVIASCVCLVSQTGVLGLELKHFQYTRQINVSGLEDDTFLAIAIDSDIYAATRSGLPDLRIVDSSGSEVPYQLQQQASHLTRSELRFYAGKVLSLKEQQSAIEVVVARPDDVPAAAGLRLSSPIRDFERQVRVDGSRDGVHWTRLVDGALIFDYSRFIDVQNFDIELPENEFQQFKLTVEGVTDERESPYRQLTRTFTGDDEQLRVEQTRVQQRSLRINKINFFYHVSKTYDREPAETDYPPESWDSTQNDEQKLTVLTVRTRREPITAFTFSTSGRNFSRKVTIEAPQTEGTTKNWAPLGQGVLSNFEFRGFRKEQLTVHFRESRESQYRILIHNEDNPPLEITDVQARGNVYRAIFLTQPTQTYRLLYGSKTAQTPSYETASVLAALPGEAPVPTTAILGAEEAMAGFRSQRPSWPSRVANHPATFVVAVCLMVAVLGTGLFRASRRLNTMSDDETIE